MNANVPQTLKQLVIAVQALFENDDLAYAAPGEPHVVSELFALLRPQFSEHTVSNEYDRREQEIKRLGRSKIIPDLIVHRVGTQDDNLLVVEVKLVHNPDHDRDIFKLRGMTNPDGEYRYAVGVHLVLDLPRRRVAQAHVYIDGDVDPKLTRWLEKRFA
jgi:hypothetical protein